ncbi:MAG: DNA alkylation repair protein, partial [Chloroflexota bacterium]|nr:DNA alkylation repair protein [Chloroflexota bacterium]
LWKRRASIICQLDSGPATDETLLFACITPNLADREFFIRKGIGWALRQYARANPDAVRRYVAEHATEMSALSRREAMKHLG